MMMHGACAPAQTASTASHAPFSDHAADHHGAAAHAADVSAHNRMAPESKPAEMAHAPSATTCCGMLCALALLPVDEGGSVPLARNASLVPEPDQGHADDLAGRLFRPPRLA